MSGMTRDRAIEILRDDASGASIWEIAEAVDMAIEALKEKIPHGEWVPCKSTRNGQVTNIDYKCSECSHHKDRPVPYCEICGAIMKKRR